MRKTVTLCALLVFAASLVNAQQQKPDAAVKEAQAKLVKQAAETAQRGRAENGQAVNMRLDLTITDDRGNGQPISKTVAVMTADRFWGRVRTQGEVTIEGNRRLPVILNVDARPTLLRDNRARVELTIEYRPAMEAFTAPPAAPGSKPDTNGLPPNVSESLAVILEDGKSVLISQSADPISDRKVKVEAKLTILR
jgi:hypothetical protein